MLFKNVAIEALAYELAPHQITSDWLEDQIGETMSRLGVPRSPGVGRARRLLPLWRHS